MNRFLQVLLKASSLFSAFLGPLLVMWTGVIFKVISILV